jgi:cytochrome b pre-mRNA-processing protein 3
MPIGFIKNLFSRDQGRASLVPLYRAVIEIARDPIWYLEGAAPDTRDGRFDMLAAIIAAVFVRLEAFGDAGKAPGVMLTELFIEDMEGQLRQDGAGDVVVGKQVGQMLSALGGRLTVYRDGLSAAGDLESALVRNLYRGVMPSAAALAFTANQLRAFHAGLGTVGLDALLAARITLSGSGLSGSVGHG